MVFAKAFGLALLCILVVCSLPFMVMATIMLLGDFGGYLLLFIATLTLLITLTRIFYYGSYIDWQGFKKNKSAR